MANQNPYEAQARTTKAMKLIAAIGGFAAKNGFTSLQVAKQADAHDREVFARLAGVNAPSDETWALVIDSLTFAQSIADQVTG